MVYIDGVSKQIIHSLGEAQATYDRGLRQRKTFYTDMNDLSSRSHMIFSILIETVNNETKQRTKSKISFVDLAGSERLSKSNLSQDVNRAKEGIKINLSLQALIAVFTKLSEYNGNGKKGEDHIPYRNNKLTYLMKDSLGGNSKTLMIVNVSPADYNSMESRTSLFFADKVKTI